jgi:hypothetical protein
MMAVGLDTFRDHEGDDPVVEGLVVRIGEFDQDLMRPCRRPLPDDRAHGAWQAITRAQRSELFNTAHFLSRFEEAAKSPCCPQRLFSTLNKHYTALRGIGLNGPLTRLPEK